jgi:hypothetical protein
VSGRGLDLTGKGKVGVSEFCEHGNEILRLINRRFFLTAAAIIRYFLKKRLLHGIIGSKGLPRFNFKPCV